MARRIMSEFALFEISSVDRPCQAPALAAIMKGGPGSGPHPGQGGRARAQLQGLKDRYAAVGRAEGWDSPEAMRAEREMLAAQRRYGVVKNICKECGGDGSHLEKCSMFGKAWGPDFVHMTEDNPLRTDLDAYRKAVAGLPEPLRSMMAQGSFGLDKALEEYCKRTFTAAQRDEAERKGEAMSGGGFPIQNEGDLKNAIRAIGRAKNPAAARAHIKTRAKALGLADLIPDTWKASPGEGAGSLMAFQPLLALAAKHDAPAASLAPIYAAIVKAAPEIDALPDGERAQTLDRLMGKCAEKLAKIVPAGSIDAFNAAVAAKGEGQMDPKEVEKLQKRAAFLELLAKATDAVKAFMGEQNMDEAAQAVFLAKTAAEQKADIDAAAAAAKAAAEKAKKTPPQDDNDEDDMGKRLKKRDDRIADLTKDLDALKAKDELAVCKELCRKAGVAEGKAEHLMKLRKIDAKIAEETLREWSAAAKQANPNLFAELGKSGTGGDFATPYEELVAKAQELIAEMKKADPKTTITIEKAKAAVYTDPRFADLAKRIKTDEAQRRMGRAAA